MAAHRPRLIAIEAKAIDRPGHSMKLLAVGAKAIQYRFAR
jgi:hypothetical protein